VVALESAVITHGLPYPQNLQLAQEMEAILTDEGALPATIAVLEGRVWVGLTSEQLEFLAQAQGVHKISSRDFAPAIAGGWTGGTTVAGTLLAAHLCGLRIFATGGIGGVHRAAAFDVSADLPQLARTPVLVVCAGAKAILDLDATLEYLETHSVPVAGYQTDEFPAFYSRSSGLQTSCRVDTPLEAASLALRHWALGMQSGVLLAVPPPEATAIPHAEIDGFIELALQESEAQGVRGQAVTPFLLQRVSQLSGGRSLRANLDLLRNNARTAGQIAHFLAG
jgi:pseudouridine-5'-phosphate glycosidase